MNGIAACFLLSVLLYGCKDIGAQEDRGLSAKVDSVLYHRGSSILLEIRNGGTSAASLESCCTSLAYYLDRYSSGGWQLEEARGMPCLLLCPSILLSVDPGGSYDCRLTVATAGQYRLRIPYRVSNEPAIGGEILSGSFVVR